MKNSLTSLYKSLFIGLTVSTMTLALQSCKNENKEEDTKEVAEEKNEAKFQNSNKEDAEFLVDAAEFNLQQAELGKLTAVKSNSDDVKTFGKMMQEMYTTKMSDVNMVAVVKQISIPTSLTEDNKEDYNTLNKQDIQDFDKKYLESVVDDHKEAIDEYSSRMNKTNDADIKKWLTLELASLREHLDVAMTLQSKLNKLNK